MLPRRVRIDERALDHQGASAHEEAEFGAAEVLLVSKQVSEAKMEAYMAEFFPRTWAKFDINNAGEIDLTESHTFMRSLLGRLNQFVLAPGSLTDITV